ALLLFLSLIRTQHLLHYYPNTVYLIQQKRVPYIPLLLKQPFLHMFHYLVHLETFSVRLVTIEWPNRQEQYYLLMHTPLFHLIPTLMSLTTRGPMLLLFLPCSLTL